MVAAANVSLMSNTDRAAASSISITTDTLTSIFINACAQGEQGATPRPTNVLYHNNGDGTFTDVTHVAGVGDTRYGVGATTGDYDNEWAI